MKVRTMIQNLADVIQNDRIFINDHDMGETLLSAFCRCENW